MIARRSGGIFRPVFAGLVLALLFIFCLCTGCGQKNLPPGDSVTEISVEDAAEAGSMALYMQGLLYESSTNPVPDKVIASYSNALRLNPENKNALASLVNCLARQKRYDEAYQVLATHMGSFPDALELQLFAAGLAEHLEKPVEAAKWCRQILANSPTNRVAANAAIRLHFEGGEDKAALDTLKRFTGRLSRSEALDFSVETIVSLYRDRNKTDPLQALKCSEIAMDFVSGDRELSDVLMLQAYCQLEASRTNRAVRTFEESYRANPANHVPLVHLGIIYAARPELLDALGRKPCETACEPSPHLIRGYAYNVLDRPEDAARELETYYHQRMRKGYFADKEFYLTLGATYEKYKDYDKIDKLFRDALCAFPEDPEVLTFAAYLW